MEDFISTFDNLKVSALSKLKEVSPYINNVTIGPNRTIIETKTPVKEKIVTTCKKTNTAVPSNKGLEVVVNKFLNELEMQRQERLQEVVSSRRNVMVDFTRRLQMEAKLEFQRKHQLRITEMQQQELHILQALEQHDKNISEEHQKLLQHYQVLAEKRRKYDDELLARQLRKQKLNSIIDQVKKNQILFRTSYQEIVGIIKSCTAQNELKIILGEVRDKLKMLPEQMDEIVTHCKTGKVSDEDSKKSSELIKEIQNIRDSVQNRVTEIETKIKNEIEQQKKEQEKQEKVPHKETVTVSAVTSINVPNPVVAKAVAPEIAKCVSRPSLKIFSELQEYLENYEKTYKQLLDDQSYKQFKFDCKKAINIPVNAISMHSTQHLLDKYTRLANLLSGKTVEVGESRINASKHPQGIAFCTDLLAKKFVLQADLMISSKPEAAFCYAAVIVSLWNDFPDFGKLILAHFHQQCPYLVPIYPPRSVGQSDEEYYRSLGYRYVDGAVEKQDKFLKRMTGFMRLYAAVLISRPKRGQTTNPHNLNYAWRWLSSILNLEPRPDITATMLHTFLETAGSTMQAAYGKMFHKMVFHLCNTYLPQLQKIDSGGPVTRLESILQKYKTERSFGEPSGMLPRNFW